MQRQPPHFRPSFPVAPRSGPITHPPSSVCQADEGETKKRRKAEDDGGIGEKSIKWAEEFDGLGEDDQYTYLEELAPRMRYLTHLCTHAGAGLASPPFHTRLPCVVAARCSRHTLSLTLSPSLSLSLSPTLTLAWTLLTLTPPLRLHPRPEPHPEPDS